MKYQKEPLSFDQQADLLLSRGLDADKTKLSNFLSIVNYYRLSGYLYPFRTGENEMLKPGTSLQPLITSDMDSKTMVMYKGIYEAGRRMPAHKHDDADELLYILSGEGKIYIDDHMEFIRPGSAVFLPKSALHFLEIGPAEPIVLLFIYSPPVVPGTASEKVID